MIKRIVGSVVAALGSLALLIFIEVRLAVRREYLPTEPAMELGGAFGPPDGPVLRFAVLGDSTAAGLGASSPRAAYPTLLAEKLGSDGFRVELSALGVSGARVNDALHLQSPHAIAFHPDLVFVGIGANDAIHVTPLSALRSDMRELIRKLKATGAALVVAGAPDMRAAAWHEPLRSLAGWSGRRVAAAVGDVAAGEGVAVVPLAELAEPYFAAGHADAYGGDGLHPGDGGYHAWAEAIYPYLTEALVSPRWIHRSAI
ncbi:MAG TPA: SGNH/GDSL hydrolase family protein [Actinomycetota bacterium]|nr:SGNH/GDSL hydrolase family protein [Actinomycetota bacterium]